LTKTLFKAVIVANTNSHKVRDEYQ